MQTENDKPMTVRKGVLEKYSDAPERTKITVPAEVRRIAGEAFRNAVSLTEIDFSECKSLTEIGAYAFRGAGSLKSVRLPDSVRYLGAGAFRECKSLESVSLPENLAEIRAETFARCTALTSAELPGGVKTIGREAFYGAENLVSVTFPEGLAAIGVSAFGKCRSLEKVTLPDSVKTILRCAFSECAGLNEIRLPAGLSHIPERMFYKCGALESAEIPGSTKIIGGYAFCSSGLKSAVLPDNMIHLGRGAFMFCRGLENVRLPAGLEFVREGTFRYCRSLTSADIPEGVKRIGDYAFAMCESLSSVRLPETLEYFNPGAFDLCGRLTSIEIPDNTRFSSNLLRNSMFRHIRFRGLDIYFPPKGYGDDFSLRFCSDASRLIAEGDFDSEYLPGSALPQLNCAYFLKYRDEKAACYIRENLVKTVINICAAEALHVLRELIDTGGIFTAANVGECIDAAAVNGFKEAYIMLVKCKEALGGYGGSGLEL